MISPNGKAITANDRKSAICNFDSGLFSMTVNELLTFASSHPLR